MLLTYRFQWSKCGRAWLLSTATLEEFYQCFSSHKCLPLTDQSQRFLALCRHQPEYFSLPNLGALFLFQIDTPSITKDSKIVLRSAGWLQWKAILRYLKIRMKRLRDSDWLKAGAIFNVRRVQSSNTSANYKLRVQQNFVYLDLLWCIFSCECLPIIYSCWFIPNCTRNHVITSTKRSNTRKGLKFGQPHKFS